jgi:hypothetical protein
LALLLLWTVEPLSWTHLASELFSTVITRFEATSFAAFEADAV